MSAAALTYGDTFTLPSVTDPATGAPVVWEISDTRTVENVGGASYDALRRAIARPVHVDADGVRMPYDRRVEPVRIGRAARVGVELALRVDSVAAASSVRVYATAPTFDQLALTDAMQDRVSGEAGALAFYLPDLSADDVRARIMGAAVYAGEHGAREGVDTLPTARRYRGAHDPARVAVAAAFASASDRDALVSAMVDAFAAEARERVARMIGGY